MKLIDGHPKADITEQAGKLRQLTFTGDNARRKETLEQARGDVRRLEKQYMVDDEHGDDGLGHTVEGDGHLGCTGCCRMRSADLDENIRCSSCGVAGS